MELCVLEGHDYSSDATAQQQKPTTPRGGHSRPLKYRVEIFVVKICTNSRVDFDEIH
jgi:hypothetical protein